MEIESSTRCSWRAAGAAAAVALAGCSIQIGGIRVPAEPLTPTMEEIAAVRHLRFDGERAAHLLGIAGREKLAAREQVYLVDVTLDELTFDDGKTSVLVTLIENPAFCGDAKVVILRRLDRITFESNRARILKAIGQREEAAMRIGWRVSPSPFHLPPPSPSSSVRLCVLCALCGSSPPLRDQRLWAAGGARSAESARRVSLPAFRLALAVFPFVRLSRPPFDAASSSGVLEDVLLEQPPQGPTGLGR